MAQTNLEGYNVSIAISLLFNAYILQNPLVPIHNSLFLQQSYYGRSVGLIGINQNGVFIAIFFYFVLSSSIFSIVTLLFRFLV